MIERDQKISDIIRNNPSRAKVFFREEMEFCFGGNDSLEVSCLKNNKDIEAITRELEEEKTDKDVTIPELDKDISAKEVIDIIKKTYHDPLKKEMVLLNKLITRLDEFLGYIPGEISLLRNLLNKLFKDLIEHMSKEELILFPLIISCENNRKKYDDKEREFNVRQMEDEHEEALKLLKRIRWLTEKYNGSLIVSKTYRLLVAGLRKFEFNIYQHMYLENNILYPIVSKF